MELTFISCPAPYVDVLVPRNDPESQAESEGWVDWFRQFLPPEENPFEPVMDIFYPIINDISRVDITRNEHENSANHTPVGVLAVSLYWREFIREILPKGSNGIHVVVSCPCNEPFTYQLNGPTVKYLGVGISTTRSTIVW
jgi:hypothetical protein